MQRQFLFEPHKEFPMTAFQEPLERGLLRTALNDVREEINKWMAQFVLSHCSSNRNRGGF
jgi:hypothetical protein